MNCIKKKFIYVAFIFFITKSADAQIDTIGISKAVYELQDALLQKDTFVIKKLVSNNIGFGHSNGWVQSKKQMLDDLYNGKLTYTQMQMQDIVFGIEKNVVAARIKTKVAGTVNGVVFDMWLSVLQVWQKQKKKWVLIARQSVKVDK